MPQEEWKTKYHFLSRDVEPHRGHVSIYHGVNRKAAIERECIEGILRKKLFVNG